MGAAVVVVVEADLAAVVVVEDAADVEPYQASSARWCARHARRLRRSGRAPTVVVGPAAPVVVVEPPAVVVVAPAAEVVVVDPFALAGLVVVVVLVVLFAGATYGGVAKERAEVELGRLAEDGGHLAGVLDARQLDDDVAPLHADVRLSDSEALDTVVENGHGLVQLGLRDRRAGSTLTEVRLLRRTVDN